MALEFTQESPRMQSSEDVYESAGRYSLPENSVTFVDLRIKGRGPAGSAVTISAHFSFYRGTGDAQSMGAGDMDKKAIGSGSNYSVNLVADGDGFIVYVKATSGETVDWLIDGTIETLK